jgi:hypothetical protein
LIFGLGPSFLYILYGKGLIQKKARWKKKNNPEDDWIYKNKEKIFDEINIVCRGSSLKKYIKKINKKIPTFFVNFTYSSARAEGESIEVPYLKFLKIFFKHSNFYGIAGGGFSKLPNDYQIDNFSNGLYPSIVYRLGMIVNEKKNKILWSQKEKAYPETNYLKRIDSQLSKRLKGTYKIYEKKKLKLSKENKRIIKLIDKKGLFHFKDFGHKNRWGAALGVIFLLGPCANRINIYGWDHYLKKNIDKYNYWELIKTMSNKGEKIFGFGPWNERCRHIFNEGIYNLHYADRLIKHKKYKIFSRLSKVYKQKRILKNIEKVIFSE